LTELWQAAAERRGQGRSGRGAPWWRNDEEEKVRWHLEPGGKAIFIDNGYRCIYDAVDLATDLLL